MTTMRAIINASAYFNPCAAYYRMFSFDNAYNTQNILVPPNKINRVHYSTISDLLRALRRYARDGEKNFIVVTHGNPQGLPIRISTRSHATFNADIMDKLRQAIAGSDDARDYAMSYQDGNGKKVFGNEQQLDNLLDLLRDIRRFALEHIEFRGCNIGAGPALEAIHKLLGSRITAAPTVTFIWSRLSTANVHGTEQWFANQVSQLPAVRRTFNRVDCYSTNYSDPDNQIVFALGEVNLGNGEKAFRLIARDADVIKGWTQAYLQQSILFATGQEPAGGGYRQRGYLPLIGFSTPGGSKPFVFPGDSFSYTDKIAYRLEPSPVTFP